MIQTVKDRLMSMIGLNFRFPVIARCYDMNREVNYLDVGCGIHSPTATKYEFPLIRYYGIDWDIGYNNTQEDIDNIDKFFEMDLSKLEFDDVPNNFFDVINMSHIIEHLHNGEEVIRGLIPKLKDGGIIYIEFPNMHSTNLPSKDSTLNFFDDPSHVRIYSLRELYNILLSENMAFVEGGRRKNRMRNLLVPLEALKHLYLYGHIKGGMLWDIMGFADYCVFRKKVIET